jgi:hypothetical protein
MSLKDEIEKLIRAEQTNLENRDHKHADYHQRQRDRFASLRVVLEEISTSIDSGHLKSRIGDNSATIELGRAEGSSWSTDICWQIEPNYDVRFGAKAGESLFHEKPGFKLEETEYYRFPEYDISEKTQDLPDEQAISQYLIKKITDKVAHYRHMESLAAKRMEGK